MAGFFEKKFINVVWKAMPVLCALLLSIVDISAIEYEILFNRLDVNHGLSSNEVSCIYKDSQGFMWFATGAGLTCYDGYEFRTFRHEIDGSLFSETYIIRISETADGKLWSSYEDGAISIFDPYTNCFYTIKEITEKLELSAGIRKVFPDKELQLLFSTDKHELCRYNYSNGEITSIPTNKRKGSLSDLYQKGNILYLVYQSGAIEIMDITQPQSLLKDNFLKSQPQPKQYNLFVDSVGELWIFMNPQDHNGLYHFVPSTGKWEHYTTTSTPALTSSLIRDVEEDADGNIWIATDHGGINLLKTEERIIQHIKNNPLDDKSISQNSVICLYRDNTNIMWCGTYKNGISYYHESIFKFKTIRFPVVGIEDAAINDCNGVYEDEKGNLWIGTNGNGLIYYDRSTGQHRQYKHNPADKSSISSDIIVCLTGDKDGNIWIGTYMGGLDCFNGKTFTHYQSTEGKLSNNSIYSLYYAGYDNLLWIGTLGGGLNCLNLISGNWTHFNQSDDDNSLCSDHIYSIHPAIGNELMIGTALGVNILNTNSGSIRTFSGTQNNRQTFKGKAINTVFPDKQGLLWIGSNNGLTVYDTINDSLYHLDKSNQLPDNDILSIMQDEQQTLWLGSKNGLLKVLPEYKEETKEYNFNCTTYYENEGIAGRTYNRNSICQTSRGEFIFGGTNGLTVFVPTMIKYNPYPPHVVLTKLFLDNQPIYPGKEYNGKIVLEKDISYTQELTLKYEERGFSLNISGLNYFLPLKNTFSYLMEGFEKEWNMTDAGKRIITYTNLPPGKYTFRVKAQNNDGVWSETPASLRIHILPPFWATPWAIFLYVVLGVILVYVLVKIILHFQKRKFKKEQERIASGRLHEMDEMKLRFFTNVSHEFRTPLTLIIAPIEKLMKSETNLENKKILKLMHENATQLLSLVNQLLDFRKIDVQGTQLLLSSGDIVIFIRNITYSFKDLSEQKNIRFSFSTNIPSLVMKFDTDKIFKTISNLLSNAFKFTPEGGEISVHLQLHHQEEGGNQFVIQVTDSGIGIDEKNQELIFNRFYQIPSEEKTESPIGTGIGLHICREFVKLHNGTISVKSEPGKGSIFTIMLPVQMSGIEEIISAPNTVEMHEHEEEQLLPVDDEKSTLLVVDDNGKFREFMKLSLQDSYNILTAGDGEEAWQITMKRLPDMVISDVMMPVTDGIVLCKRIKQDIRTSHIPVVLLTAKSAEASKLIGLEAGADDYIGKPFNMDMLMLKIGHIIEMKNRMQKQFMQSTGNGIQLSHVNINSLDEELMKKAILFIEEQIGNPELSVEWLSREMGMSRVNFYKKTMSITGKTPVELIRTIRMKHAAMLLEKGKMRVNEVAFKVGINDNKLFRKYFREEFGVLPSDYVETNK